MQTPLSLQKLSSFWQKKFVPFLGSRTFFYVVVALLVVQAIWLVLSAQYPMAFDENFHMGIIQIYSNQWLPFFSAQPINADSFGALARDPSYMYHYLMSFPYRIVAALVSNWDAQIIIMRLLNVAIFASALFVFQRVLRLAKASPALTNSILLFFVLIPVVPQLAAHINYDNLIVLLVGIASLLGLKFLQSLQKQHFPLAIFLGLIAICIGASLVKYAFLPIALAIGIYMIVAIFWRSKMKRRAIWQDFIRQLRTINRPILIGLCFGIVALSGLFFERYGMNVILYKNPVPDCDQVLTIDHCLNYGPWARNYMLTQAKVETVNTSPLAYGDEWLTEMYRKLFFTINGDYVEKEPLPIPILIAKIVGIVGVITFVIFGWPLLRRHPALIMLLIMVLCYIAVLWWRNYSEYNEIGTPVAINGRYLIPLLPLILLLIGLSSKVLFDKFKYASLKPILLVAMLILFLQGGGIMTYIIRSDPADDNWYWKQPQVVEVNHIVRSTLHKVVIGSD